MTDGFLMVISGPPGAGKSTVAAAVADRLEHSVLMEGDAFFGFVRRGAIDPWRPEAHEQNVVVIQAAAAAAGRFAAGGFPTVYDGVLGPWFLSDFVTASGLDDLDYVLLLPSLERCLARVRDRPNHGFRDEPAARHMYHEFAGAEIDQRHVFADPPDVAHHVAEHILAVRGEGRLKYRPPH